MRPERLDRRQPAGLMVFSATRFVSLRLSRRGTAGNQPTKPSALQLISRQLWPAQLSSLAELGGGGAFARVTHRVD